MKGPARSRPRRSARRILSPAPISGRVSIGSAQRGIRRRGIGRRGSGGRMIGPPRPGPASPFGEVQCDVGDRDQRPHRLDVGRQTRAPSGTVAPPFVSVKRRSGSSARTRSARVRRGPPECRVAPWRCHPLLVLPGRRPVAHRGGHERRPRRSRPAGTSCVLCPVSRGRPDHYQWRCDVTPAARVLPSHSSGRCPGIGHHGIPVGVVPR